MLFMSFALKVLLCCHTPVDHPANVAVAFHNPPHRSITFAALWAARVAVSAQPLLAHLGTGPTTRASFALYNTAHEVQALLGAVARALELLR